MTETTSVMNRKEILANARQFEHVLKFGEGSSITLTTYPEGKQPNSIWYKLGLVRSETKIIRKDGKDSFKHSFRIGIFGMEFDEGFFESVYPGKFESKPIL